VPPWANCSRRGRGRADAGDAVLDLLGIAGEFLTEGQRRRILQMGAADLDDRRKLHGLGRERRLEVNQRRDQLALDLLDRGDMHGGWEAVVG